MALEIGSFARGFVAKLIASGVSAIRPHAREDRRGFQAVVDLLNKEIDDAGTSQGDRDRYMALVRLRNSLQASNIGAFDSNPFYEEIVFTVSKPYAQALFGELPDFERDIIGKAADAFIREKMPYHVDRAS